jgi:hypothetical protein
MQSIYALYLAVACAVLVMVMHPRQEGFPFLFLGALAAGAGAGGGGLAFMKSGAIWSKGGRPASVVSFYRDPNFGGPRKDYASGAVQNSLSKGKFGLGKDKENDTYSSLQVPNGMKVQVWEHNNKEGATLVYGPGNYANLYGFNDKISSLEVSGSAASLDTPETLKCRQQAAAAGQYSLRQAFPGQDPYWQCPSGWVDTGCTWGMGTDFEQRQCRKK